MYMKKLAKPPRPLLPKPTDERVNRPWLDVMRWVQFPPSDAVWQHKQPNLPQLSPSQVTHIVFAPSPPKNSSMELCSGAYFRSSSHTLTTAVENRNHNKHAGVEMNKLFFTAGRIPGDERCSILSFGKTTLWTFILIYVFWICGWNEYVFYVEN